MKRWTRPYAVEEDLEVNENVATVCYAIACEVGDKGINGVDNRWKQSEYGENITHSTSGTSGSCADPLSNRVLADDSLTFVSKVQEHNSMPDGQGWINGEIDDYDTPLKPGAIVYWHTVSSDNKRRWNHYGHVKLVDDTRPNHS